MHVEDEEQSLLPRLARKDALLDECLATMEAQHGEHMAGTDALIAALHDAARSPNDELVRRALERRAQSQVLAFDEHLALEERSVFPAIEQHLTAADRRVVIGELRARRQRDDA